MAISGAQTTLETTVLIVGGGPTGLALAGDLGSRGVQCILIEEGRTETLHPRASAIDVRSMEAMRRWGIAKAVREAVSARGELPRIALFCTSLAGYDIARIEQRHESENDPGPASPERPQPCNQLWLDPILRDLATSHESARVLFEWRLSRLTQRGDCVLADVTDLSARQNRRIAAQYVIDCTGARSAIRSSIGVDAPDENDATHFVSALLRIPDLTSHHAKELAGRIAVIGPDGIRCVLEMLDDRGLWRLKLRNNSHREPPEATAISAMLEEIAGRTVPHQVLSVQRWEGCNYVAPRFGEGNILLAGDAAHLVRPLIGAGLDAALGSNLDLGIADAFNLAWKIEARLAGWGSSGLVDSYGAERRSAALRSLAHAAACREQDDEIRSHAEIALDTSMGAAERKAMGRAIERAPLPRAANGLALGCRYAGSPIVAADGTPEPAMEPFSHRPTTWPGARAPHAALPGGISTLDLYGRGFVLLRLGQRAPEPGGFDRAFAHRGVPLTFRTIEDPAIARLHERQLVLVRPDGHVAWRGDEPPADPLGIVDRVRGAG